MYRDFCRREGVPSDIIYETTFCREFNFGFHAQQEKTQAGVEQQVQRYARVEEQLQGSCKEGRRGYAPACFDLPQVRANSVIARVGCFLLDMPQKLIIEQTIPALLSMTRKIGFHNASSTVTMNIADLQLVAFLPQSTLDALLYFQTITLPRSNIGDVWAGSSGWLVLHLGWVGAAERE